MYSRISSTTFIEYKLQGRKPSIATLEDSATNKQSEFTCKQLLANTKNSKIRVFSDLTDQNIVIKSAHNIGIGRNSFETELEFRSQIADEEQYLRKELALMQQAYPNDAPYGLDTDFHCYPHDLIWSYRLIIPYISGITFNEYASKPHENTTWLLFFVAIGKEIKRIHQRGVIHGDIKGDNGLVCLNTAEKDSYEMHFIDFGRAYSIHNEEAETTDDIGEYTSYWAPERKVKAGVRGPAPDVKQDVYSYGHMLLCFIQKAPGFKEAYPKLFFSINATQHPDPAQRPELEQIINQANCG